MDAMLQRHMPPSRLSHFNHLAEMQFEVYARPVGQIHKFGITDEAWHQMRGHMIPISIVVDTPSHRWPKIEIRPASVLPLSGFALIRR
jgi:hypothetical protein